MSAWVSQIFASTFFPEEILKLLFIIKIKLFHGCMLNWTLRFYLFLKHIKQSQGNHKRRPKKRTDSRYNGCCCCWQCILGAPIRTSYHHVLTAPLPPTNQHYCAVLDLSDTSELWWTVMCVTKPVQQRAVGWRNPSAIIASQCLWKQLRAGRTKRWGETVFSAVGSMVRASP